jgi:RNA polymerase sigma factor (sigma-70 family)
MVSYNDSKRLVLCCQKGDRQSLGELAQLVRERLWGYLCRMTSDDDTAGDVLQEVLLTVLLRIKQLRSPDRFWSWVSAIVRSKVQENFRRSYSRARGENEFRLRSAAQQQCDFQIRIDQREALRQLYLAGQNLGGLYAEVFELRCFKSMSYQKIAGVMECDCKNVYVRFHRARKLLCERFSSDMDEYF